MGDTLVKGLLLGLSTGGFCLGTSAPALLPYFASYPWEGARPLVRRGAQFLAGRLLAYLVLALLMLALGTRVRPSPLAAKATAAAMVLLALLLILYGLSRNFPQWKLCRLFERSGAVRRFPFLAGFALGVNVCPPLMLACTYLLTVHAWGAGLAFAAAFFVGTTVYLLPLFFASCVSRVPSLRGAAEIAAIFSGAWFLANALALWRG